MPFIEGALVASEGSAEIDVIDPSNGQHCLSVPAGCQGDVDRAVASARGAVEDERWKGQSPSSKKKTLFRFADLIESEAPILDALDAGEMGKPVSLKMGSAASAASLVRFYAEAIDKLVGNVYTSDRNSLVLHRRVARGVVAAIAPWNFPTYLAALKIAPALAAGNSVVLKPSELSSCSALRLAQLAMQAGLPPGVLNVVPGLGETVGRALGLHMDVDMVTFTGSTEVGKLMLQYAGQSNMKLVVAECGGKSPQIVFADGIDLDAAADSIARFLLTNQGQVCSVGSRLLVQRSVEGEVVEKIAQRFKQVVMGDARDPKTTFGPLASAVQCARVMAYVETARGLGAELVLGGSRALRDTGGHFVEPTLFRNVPPTAQIAREEVFGPVLAVIPFEDESEAIRLANDTIYGLSAYVWTSSLSTGMRMARGIRSSVKICGTAPAGEGAGLAASSEPVGQSGLGIGGGLDGMESYFHRQRVWINHA